MIPRCPDLLTKDQIRQFQENGFLVFSDVLKPGEVELAREALSRIARELTESQETAYSAPKRNGANQSGATFKRPDSRSMLQVEPGFDPGGKSPQEIELMARKFMWFCTEDPVFEDMVCPAGRIHGIVECLLGADPILLDVSKAVAVPVPAGGAMFFYGMLPHETPPNRSPHRRRALQFHFRGSQTRIVDEETYDRLFVDRSGSPASCRAASRTGF